MYDDYLPRTPSRTLPLVAAALAILAVLAGLGALFLSYSRAEQLDLEVQSLRREVTRLRGEGETLAGRVQSAESTLKKKDAGLAPLARRVLKSVFTVETATGFGSGFAGWVEDGKLVIVTADHVIDDDPDGKVAIVRKGGSWGGTVVARDPKNDLAAIRLDGRPAGAAPLWRARDAESPPPGRRAPARRQPVRARGHRHGRRRLAGRGARDPDRRGREPRQLRRPRGRQEGPARGRARLGRRRRT